MYSYPVLLEMLRFFAVEVYFHHVYVALLTSSETTYAQR